jgi:hypothetical protein
MTEFEKSSEDCVATPLAIAVSRILRASVSRAAELRRSERTRFSSASDDEVGGFQRDARAEKINKNVLE